MNKDIFLKLVHDQLVQIGVDPKKGCLKDTPARVFRSFNELTQFHRNKGNLDELFVFFPSSDDKKLAVVSKIFFTSLCEHHILPFFGHIHIGYIPNKKVLGLSKFKRIIELVTKQLAIQEKLTSEIFDLFMKKMQPHGLIVFIEAKHTCTLIRGVKDTQSTFKTVKKSSFFETNRSELDLFFHMIDKT